MKTFGKFEVVARQVMRPTYDVVFKENFDDASGVICRTNTREEADMRCERLNAALKGDE
jgi:hypothetical protein